MKKRVFIFMLCLCLLAGLIPLHAFAADATIDSSGTWGGIDWTLTTDGTLTIAPTKGEPVQIPNKKTPTSVGQWPEAVVYNSAGTGVSIAGWPYERSKVKKLIIEEGVTAIGSFAAQGFTNLTGEVIIPSTVIYIGQEAFQSSTMTKLTFAKGGTDTLTIAQGGLKDLRISEVELPSDRPAIYIKAWLLNNCDSLTHVTLPANVVSINGTNEVDYLYFSASHNSGNYSALTYYNDNLKTITFGSEEVKKLFFDWGNPITTIGTKSSYTTPKTAAFAGLTYGISVQAVADKAKPGETVKLLQNSSENVILPAGVTLDANGFAFTGETVNAPAEPAMSTSVVYGTKLSAISLPAGWKWLDASVVPTVNNSGYTAYYIPADVETFDWSVIDGWNATEQRIERTVDVTVTPRNITVAMADCEIYVGGWPEYSYSVEGLLDGDELISAPGYGTSADLNKPGTYTVYLDGADAGPNYTVTHVEGKLTVKELAKPTYAVNVSAGVNGMLTASLKEACAEDIVTLTVTPNSGYTVGALSAAAGENAVALTKVSDNVYTFKMPSAAVTVSAVFAKIETPKPDLFDNYIDLDKTAWYADGVYYCIENDLMIGIDAERFAPEAPMTRAALVSVLWRMEGEPKVDHKINFKDVAAGAWYTDAITWASYVGVVTGYSAREFGPDDVVTREQMAAILYRYAAYKGEAVAAADVDMSFSDWKNVSGWAEEAVAWACNRNLIAGKEVNNTVVLAPKDIATRAQTANIIYRFIENI